MNEPNLVITGMMGTGKSSIARVLAKRLNRKFVDTDNELEKQFGKTVSVIFKEDGEPAFRAAEYALCQNLANRSDLVIATGGGSLLTLRALRLFDNAEVFCLDASFETLWDRTKKSSRRPLLEKKSTDPKDSQTRLRDLMIERHSAYNQVYHHIWVDGLERDEIAQEIQRRFELGKSLIEKRRFLRMPSLKAQTHIIQSGLISQIAHYFRWLGFDKHRAIFISDHTVSALFKERISQNCANSGQKVEWLSFPAGEHHKNIDTVQSLFDALLKVNTNRSDVIVAIGGGVVGDIAGFVAATYMRGTSFVQIPTTLLAMVDSSIGGKTGIDLPQGKNLMGTFKQANAILVDPEFLKTLPPKEVACGMAEAIKHAIIEDPGLFESLESDTMLSPESVVERAALVKMRIVQEDPFEEGKRSLLNLGHTFGHAIEKATQYAMPHGFAVAVGLVLASELSFNLGLSNVNLRPRIEQVLTRYGLPIYTSGVSPSEIISAMSHDKKSDNQGLRFILPFDIGDVRRVPVNDRGLISKVINTALK